MNRSLLRHASLCARNLLLSPSTVKPKPCPSLAPLLPLAAASPFRLGLDSFQPVSSNKLNLTQIQGKVFTASDEGVSDQELKKHIERYYGGDEEAVPLIFEAILKRKLAGKNDDADNKLMKEICGKWGEPSDIGDEFDPDEEFSSDDDEFGSDLDKSSESDEDVDESLDEKQNVGKKRGRDG